MSSSLDNQQQAGSSSSWRRFNANNSSSSPHSLHAHQNNKKHKLDVDSFWSWDDDDDDDDDDGNINPEDSDEDMFTVPDVEAIPPDAHPISTSTVTKNNNATSNNNPAEIGFQGKRRRGRNPVDKEYRRLKRLLRNRVSAQQARERKKVYVNDLESKAKELEDANFNLEEKISTLINENTMLRKVLMNTRPKVDESIEQKQDRSVK